MPKRCQLLKSQKNEIFKQIQKEGLEPANFSWSKGGVLGDYENVPVLNYLHEDYYFKFSSISGEHCCTFSPGLERIVEYRRPKIWANQKSTVEYWLFCIRRETEEPDLWAEMEKYKTSVSLALPEQLLNEPISASESEEIAQKVNLLADKTGEIFKLNAEQNEFVRNKLNYLTEAAKRQRSIDWVHTSIGVFVTIAMGLALAPEQAKELWLLFKDILGGIIHLIG
jgi:hypothetical protein